MQLPTRGCLVDPSTGRITWAWEHNTPDAVFDVLPPVEVNSAGVARSLAPPNAVVLDLTDLQPGDIYLLYGSMQSTRIVLTPGRPTRFRQVIASGGTEVLIDHPLQAIIDARRPQLPTPPPAPPADARPEP